MEEIAGLGFIAVFVLVIVGLYVWLFGTSKVTENDDRP